MQIRKSTTGKHYDIWLDGKAVAKTLSVEDGLAALYVLLGRPKDYHLVYDPDAQQVGKRFNELPTEPTVE